MKHFCRAQSGAAQPQAVGEPIHFLAREKKVGATQAAPASPTPTALLKRYTMIVSKAFAYNYGVLR